MPADSSDPLCPFGRHSSNRTRTGPGLDAVQLEPQSRTREAGRQQRDGSQMKVATEDDVERPIAPDGLNRTQAEGKLSGFGWQLADPGGQPKGGIRTVAGQYDHAPSLGQPAL